MTFELFLKVKEFCQTDTKTT